MLFVSLIGLLISPSFALKVMVDAGHGGSDAGANREGIKESTITLEVAKKLHDLLSANKDFEVILTRTNDVSMDLDQRVHMAQSQLPDLFLSIHANASTDPKASGAEFYFQNQLESDGATVLLDHQENQKGQNQKASPVTAIDLSPFNSELRAVFLDLLDQSRIRASFELSKQLRESWNGQKKSKSSSLKQAPFQVVSRTTIPSSLVEIGFLTNPKDFTQLQTDSYLQTVAESLYEGLIKYKKIAPKKL